MTPCVPWEGTMRKDGYGQVVINGKSQIAHRVAWKLEYGEFPDYPREVLDHLCRNRACVNVDHLEITSIGENVLRGETLAGINKRKTHCNRGHDLTNAYVTKQGKRQCNQCRLENHRRYAAEGRAVS